MYSSVAFPGGSEVKNWPARAGDTRDVSLMAEGVRSPGERNGSPLQHSYLGNPIDRAWWAAVQGS